jgi:hypothetical protein
LQILEQPQRLRPIWKQIQSGCWIFGDGNGAAVNVIVSPVNGDFKDARDLGHRQGASDVAWMRLTALLKQPLF